MVDDVMGKRINKPLMRRSGYPWDTMEGGPVIEYYLLQV
jgi:hypothetical protein